MLTPKQTKELIEYWMESSKENLKTMKGLYEIKRYGDCLFFGHLMLEKILKAFVVKKTKDHAPYTHKLVFLTKLAKLDLSMEELEFLEEVNSFNLESRYPDQKSEFYKTCTKNFTYKYYKQIIKLYKKLCQALK